MHANNIRFRMEYLQRSQQASMVNALMITVFGVVTAALAPQILYDYVLQNADPAQQILILQNIPAASYGLAALFVVYALAMNLYRSRQLRALDQELQLLSYTGGDECCGHCEPQDMGDEMMTLSEAMAEAEMTAKKSAKRKVAKKANTKTAKKKSE